MYRNTGSAVAFVERDERDFQQQKDVIIPNCLINERTEIRTGDKYCLGNEDIS